LVFLPLILFIDELNCTLILDIKTIFFYSKKGRPHSIISDISKVPPFIYESAGIVRNDSNNSNDYASLKKKLEYYERLLFEKELLLKMQEDEINFLKKKTQSKEVTFIGNCLLISKYINFGASTSFLLSYYNISSSSFYYNTRLFFDSGIRKRKSTFKGFSYTNDGKKVSDNYIKQLLVELLTVNDPLNSEFFYKTLGSKKYLLYLDKSLILLLITKRFTD
jgi:hypothetical protein